MSASLIILAVGITVLTVAMTRNERRAEYVEHNGISIRPSGDTVVATPWMARVMLLGWLAVTVGGVGAIGALVAT